MRSEGAAPGPVAPLCGALSLMLGALLGKGKAGRASVSPALGKFAGRVGPGPGEPEGGGVAGTLGRALVPPGMPAPGAERPFPSREDPVGRRVRGTWANSAGPKSPDSGCFPGAWGRGWGGHCRPHAEFRADLTQPQQSQCGVGEPASLPPFPPALRPQSPSQSDWDWRSRRADRQWGLEKRPWPREERVLTAQLAGPPREPRWGPVCLGRAERWWARWRPRPWASRQCGPGRPRASVSSSRQWGRRRPCSRLGRLQRAKARRAEGSQRVAEATAVAVVDVCARAAGGGGAGSRARARKRPSPRGSVGLGRRGRGQAGPAARTRRCRVRAAPPGAEEERETLRCRPRRAGRGSQLHWVSRRGHRRPCAFARLPGSGPAEFRPLRIPARSRPKLCGLSCKRVGRDKLPIEVKK